jgi:hypothetical protein
MPRRILRSAIAALLVGGALAAPACGGQKGPDIVARMNTAKSMAESFGFTAYGAPSTGNVEEGKEARVPLSLKSGCYQIFVFPGDGIKGIDLSLSDPSGKTVGTTTKGDGQSAIKQCVTEQATYTLVVKSSGGSGAFIAQPYASAQGASNNDNPDNGTCTGPDCPPDDGGDNPPMGGTDDCSSGPDLALGATVKGSTVHKMGSVRPSCAASDGSVAVYRTHVDGRHKLVVDLDAKFDAVVAVFRAANDGYLCDSINEIECSDDAQGLTNKSHVETVVDTGDYGVLIAGFDGDRGDYEIKAQLADAPSLESICATARPITPGVKVEDVLDGTGSNFHATCSNGEGDEALYKLDLKARSRLRLTARGTAGEVTLSLRNRCEDPSSEVACSNRYVVDGYGWSGLMNAGSYTLIADTLGSGGGSTGSIEMQVDSAPELGAGTADGETCKDAKALPTNSTVPLAVDTFFAKGDVHVACAADAAADVVYKLDIKSKSRLFISNGGDDEGHHVVALQKTCGDSKGEVACETLSGKGIETTVDPGAYFVIVKGKNGDDFGRARINVRARDLGEAQKACKAAPKIASGTPISDTTSLQADKFVSPGCGGVVAQQQSGDRVYQFTVKDKSHVHIELKNAFYNAILSLRSDCADSTKGEIVCATQYSKVIDRDVDAGTYYLVVDGTGPMKSEGNFTVEMTAKSIK